MLCESPVTIQTNCDLTNISKSFAAETEEYLLWLLTYVRLTTIYKILLLLIVTFRSKAVTDCNNLNGIH